MRSDSFDVGSKWNQNNSPKHARFATCEGLKRKLTSRSLLKAFAKVSFGDAECVHNFLCLCVSKCIFLWLCRCNTRRNAVCFPTSPKMRAFKTTWGAKMSSRPAFAHFSVNGTSISFDMQKVDILPRYDEYVWVLVIGIKGKSTCKTIQKIYRNSEMDKTVVRLIHSLASKWSWLFQRSENEWFHFSTTLWTDPFRSKFCSSNALPN